MTPDLIALARDLFSRHGGDVAAARREIREHGKRLDAERRIVDAELAELKREQEKPS